MRPLRPLVIYVGIGAAIALGACGVSKTKTTNPDDNGGVASRLPPSQRGERLDVAIIGPTPADEITTTSSSISLEGLAFGAPSEVRWDSPAGSGTALGTDTWAAVDVPLIPGENFITIDAVASDGTHASKGVLVRRNNFLGVVGNPQTTPAAGFVGDATDVVVSVGIDTSVGNIDPASVKLAQMDPSGGVAGIISTMFDDGNFGVSGDEIPGDGVYSARFRITKSAESALTLGATATDMTGAAAEVAAMGTIAFVPHPTEAELTGAAAAAAAMDDGFQSKKGDLTASYGAAAAAIAQDPNVDHSGLSAGGTGTWAVTTAGIVVGMMDGNPDERGSVEVGNHATFCGAAAHQDFGASDEGADNADDLRARSCPSFETTNVFSDDDVTIDRLRQLTRHGLVFLTMHGTSYDDLPGTPAAKQLPAHEFLLTAEKVTPESLRKYELELKTVQMAIGPVVAGTRRFFITPKFIDALPGRFQNSFIYVGACRSFWNGEFAAAFLRKGAAAYFGYSDMVKSAFAYQTGKAFLQCLLDGRNDDGSSKSTADCFTAEQHDEGSGDEKRAVQWPASAAWGASNGSKLPAPVPVIHHPAYFKMLARQPVTIASVASLRNAGFEEVDRSNAASPQSTAWLSHGDARVMSKLGGYNPTDGTKMGLISTGLGFTQTNGELYQTFCVPAGTAQLSYDWNFISAEFKSYCNDPKYQDNLKVTIEETDAAGATTVLQAMKIGDLCDTVVDSLFKVPDYGYIDNDGKTYATGWKHFGPFDVSKWAGAPKNITLRFSLNDLGDSLYDTVVLLDNITLQ
ncbi:MAG: hypothetical protein QOI66_3951 [Myxococcales bacterium]|nr:hypothetical protein [Myxococcales bacterium]